MTRPPPAPAPVPAGDPAPASASPDSGEGLQRTLRLRDLVLIVVGTVIGSGIFLVPGPVLTQVDGHVGLALTVWFLAGVLSLLGALTYGELGAADPEAGGLYVYVRDAFGSLPAFLYGWTLFFVISSGSIATLAVAFTSYLEALVPLGAVAEKVVPLLMIATVAGVNVLGTRKGASLQNWTTLLKVGAILVMSVLLIALGGGGAEGAGGTGGSALGSERPVADLLSLSMLSAVGTAMIAVLWAYEGWQYVTFSAGETVDPQRTFPRGIVLGTVGLIAVYVLANVGYLSALDTETAMTSGSIASDAVATVLGPAAGTAITLAILVSMFSAANGLTLTAPRVYWAMARDGVFFQRLSRIHPTFNTPAFAIVGSSAWAMVLALTGTFEQLLTYVVFVGWIFYALGAMSIFVYRRRQPDRPRPFQVPGYPWTPAIFVLVAAAIVLNTMFAQPVRAFLGIAVVLLGLPAFWLWRRRNFPPRGA